MIKEYYKSKVGNQNVSKNFKYKEFACKDGTDKFLLDYDMIPVIQKFRDFVEYPVRINSAYRTESYNKKVGGSYKSNHLKGQAFDIPFIYEYKNLSHSIYNMGAFFNTLKVKGIIKYSWRLSYRPKSLYISCNKYRKKSYTWKTPRYKI